MTQSVVVGVDGSAESSAAAEWAARQARRSGRALRMVHAGGPEAPLAEQPGDPAEPLPEPVRVLRDRLLDTLPDLEIHCEHVPGSPAHALVAAGEREGLLVLGSRGRGGFAGLLVGSVAVRAATLAACPVVLVRPGAEGRGASGDVVVGVEGGRPCDEVLAFAFEQAAELGTGLRALESLTVPAGPYVTDAPMAQPEIRESMAEAETLRLRDALARWREKYPEVGAEAEVTGWPAGRALVEASRSAALVVVGRRTPRLLPAAPRLGGTAHAVLHHAHGPVAVVPHA
ncbi:universal stress protein [Kitasatospora sp. DSM 101779]|uniref:universal stress protein n=1 Tax=Kitasatospora sp. DSM 101779 TaxID=2853165 RepID=UPI002954A797|nr:universal stress protein [Kitasatospora sp. DSM 101779]